MIRFGILGAGWRSEFFLRIAALMPDTFEVTGIYIRNPVTREKFISKYSVNICSSIDEVLAACPDFVVSCICWDDMWPTAVELAERGVAVLCETPVKFDGTPIEDFKKLIKPEWRIQVAEQYHFQPKNQAVKAVIDSGLIGDVHQVQICCCHDYHAVSLIRFFLGIGLELPESLTVTLPDPLNVCDDRSGIFEAPEKRISRQRIQIMKYGDKSAVYDFSDEQYFSDLRASRLVIRGVNGEIVNDRCTYLDGNTVMSFTLDRVMRGANENLDGLYLENIVGNGRVLYTNPFPGARMTDDEIAIATCLVKMKEYADTGVSFYSPAEAAVDAKTAFMN